jgi:hypothetical protein
VGPLSRHNRVTLLTAVLTHLGAPAVREQLAYLRALSPENSFVACHGGTRANFGDLDEDDALFIEDPSLRGPHFEQSINRTLSTLYAARVRDDPAVEYVYLIEFDYLILRADFADVLMSLSRRHDAALVGKYVGGRNDTNWPHYLATRDDDELNGFVAAISRRDDPATRFGCLGTGILLRRDALEAFCSLPSLPDRYRELLLPTIVHHLGFNMLDVDAVSDLYMPVRWLPEFTVAEAVTARRSGARFVHPFKRLDRLGDIVGAPPTGSEL